MRSLLRSLVEDPPPSLIFELTTEGIVGVRRRSGESRVSRRAEARFAEGTLDPAPTRPNIVNAGEFAAGLGSVIDELGPRNGSETAVILPDASSRLTVLDFDELPKGADDRLQAIRERLAKTVPFDISAARIAYQASSAPRGTAVLAALTPAEVVRQYEDAFGQLGLWGGYVTVSSAAALNLVSEDGPVLFVKLAPSGAMTLAAIDSGAVRLVRNVDLGPIEGREADAVLDEMLTDLYPTQVFVADHLGQSIEDVALCGFGDLSAAAEQRLPKELGCTVTALKSSEGPVGRNDAGIWGYLSLS